MTEPIVALRWLYPILTTDSVLAHGTTGVLGGWHDIAPANAKSPFGIVRQLTAATDLTGLEVGGTLIWVPLIMQVNLYDRVRGDYSFLNPLAQRVWVLLHGKAGTTADGIVYGCHRTKINTGLEVVGDVIERFITQEYTMEVVAN